MLNSRIEVLHIIGAFCSGGAEWFVVNLIRSMKEQGISVGLLALSSRQDDAGKLMRKLLENEGVFYEFGPTEKVRLRSAFWYTKKIQEIKPNIVHLHTINTELAHYLASKLLPNSSLIYRTLHSTFVSKKKVYLNALSNNHAITSIACSDSVNSVYKPFVQGKIITIKNGVKFDWPIKTEENSRNARTQLNLKNGVNHFLSVGRLDGDSLEVAPKGHDILVKAWMLADMGQKNCQLHILGDGNLRNDLEKLTNDDKSIIFHGVRKDVPDWLLAADCYVMPSRYEGLPIAGIEALGTGIPSLFSNIPPLLELNASGVLWSEVNDIEQLSINMKKTLTGNVLTPLQDVEKIRHKFGIKNVAISYITLYQLKSI